MSRRFGELDKGDRFIYQKKFQMVKTARIKDGNDGYFYTAVDVNTGNHCKILNDTEVWVIFDEEKSLGVEVLRAESFSDGFVHIIIKNYDDDDNEGKCFTRILNAEYDEPITLRDIEEDYPDVDWVIFEDLLKGEIFSFNEYNDGKWRRHGKTIGYA